jgi:hypothetical protein
VQPSSTAFLVLRKGLNCDASAEPRGTERYFLR